MTARAEAADLAREVLDGSDESDDRFLDFYEARNIAQTLARAVIDLTAEVDAYREENTRLREQAARVKALADRLENEAADDFDGVSGTSVSLVEYETAKAIRAALEGENR